MKKNFKQSKSKYRANYIEYLMNGGLLQTFVFLKESFFDPSDNGCDITRINQVQPQIHPNKVQSTTAAATKFKQRYNKFNVGKVICTSMKNAEECKQ